MIIDTEKIVKDYGRFCKGQDSCKTCPLASAWRCKSVRNINEEYPIIESWIAEHPVKTYLIDFREKFPNGNEDFPLIVRCCVASFYGEGARPEHCEGFDCKKCWNREMK